MHIASDRLQVELAEPGVDYCAPRFDWHGLVMQVTLDGQHTFCATELPGRSPVHGLGLCGEFGIFTPVGFDDAPVGAEFPKFGIGLLRRPDTEPYRFHRMYDLTPFPRSIVATENRATFTVYPVECCGYAARVTKVLRVAGPSLTVAYRFENVGSREIVTDEYCHNFLALDGHGIGPEYRLRFSAPADSTPLPELLRVAATEVTWQRAPVQAFYAPLCAAPAATPTEWWELRHLPSGVGVREQVTPGWSKLVLWGTERVVSAEAFIGIRLAPGQTLEWRRDYTFFGG